MAIIDDFEGIAKGMKGELKPQAKLIDPIRPEPTCIICNGTGLVGVPFNQEACRYCEEGLKHIPVPPGGHS